MLWQPYLDEISVAQIVTSSHEKASVQVTQYHLLGKNLRTDLN